MEWLSRLIAQSYDQTEPHMLMEQAWPTQHAKLSLPATEEAVRPLNAFCHFSNNKQVKTMDFDHLSKKRRIYLQSAHEIISIIFSNHNIKLLEIN